MKRINHLHAYDWQMFMIFRKAVGTSTVLEIFHSKLPRKCIYLHPFLAATNAKFPILQTGIHTPIPKRISQQEVTCPSVGSLQMAS